jgi:aspartate racemase
MKKIGIIGGVGPESTVVYYKLIVKRFREKFSTKEAPSLLINSINMMHMAGLLANNDITRLADFLSDEIKTLERAGVTHGAISSNTPHIVFDELQSRTSIKLISILDVTCAHIKATGVKRVLLLGTKTTMSAGFYHAAARKSGLELLTPSREEQEYIHEKYLNELLFNDIKTDTKERFLTIVNDFKKHDAIEGLILGGTELPLILDQGDFRKLMVFDSAAIHVDKIVDLYSDPF